MKVFKNLRKYLPTPKQIAEFRYLHIFGDSLKQPELWTFNRQTTSKGIAIGIFCAFLPMPFQIIPTIFIAAMIGGNLPFAVAGMFISNPITWVPVYTPCYLLGAKIIQIEPIALSKINILELGTHYVALWLGCLIVGICLSITAHFSIDLIWRLNTQQRWKRRALSRLNKIKKDKNKQASN